MAIPPIIEQIHVYYVATTYHKDDVYCVRVFVFLTVHFATISVRDRTRTTCVVTSHYLTVTTAVTRANASATTSSSYNPRQ